MVRTGGDRSAPGRRALARRGDPTAAPGTHRTVHDDDSRPCKRGRPRTRRRSDPSAVGSQPRLGRECHGRGTRRTPGQVVRRPHARGLRSPSGRGRLPSMTGSGSTDPLREDGLEEVSARTGRSPSCCEIRGRARSASDPATLLLTVAATHAICPSRARPTSSNYPVHRQGGAGDPIFMCSRIAIVKPDVVSGLFDAGHAIVRVAGVVIPSLMRKPPRSNVRVTAMIDANMPLVEYHQRRGCGLGIG